MTTTIRISDKTHQMVASLARAAGTPMQEIVEHAVEQYRRQQLLEQANAAYAELQTDPVAQAAWIAERATWDATLHDGLVDIE